MNLKQLINKSAYGTIGYTGSTNDLIKTDKYFAYNRDVINNFAQVIIATNFDSEEHINDHALMCKHHFPNCILLNSTNNDKIFLYFFNPFFFTKSLQATPKAWVQKPFSSLDFMILCCLWVILTPMLPIISAATNRM